MQVEGATAPAHCAQWWLPRPHQRLVAHFSVRSRDAGDLFDRLVGNHSLQALDVQPDSVAELALPRDLPAQHEVFRSAGRLPIAERQPARGNFSRRLRRAESATSPGRRRCKSCDARTPAPRPVLKSLVSVDRALMRASNVETNKLEKHITFLATTAAVTPFIGLFGTVLGIISAFQGIGAQGSTSLDVVAPGIADALIATAAGLAAAIPAVYFYNLLTQRVKGARVGDGRLLARVPEHRRAQLHLMPKVQSFDHEKGGHSRRGRRTSTSLAEINVVPLVDVMLVLLIIFMVTAPMMQRGLEIQLPVARRGQPISAEPVYVTLPLSYRKDKRVRDRPAGQRGDGADRRPRRARAPGARVAPDEAGVSADGCRRERAGISERDGHAQGRRRRSHRPRGAGRPEAERDRWNAALSRPAPQQSPSPPGRGGRSWGWGPTTTKKMEAIVSDILQSRKREPDGLKKTAAISLAAHAAARGRSFC